MKKAMKLMIGMVVMVIAIQVQAEGSLNVSVEGDKDLKVEVSQIKGKATSYIEDSRGKVVYREKVEEGENLQIAMDISQLNAGSYKLVIEDDVKFQSIPFKVTAEGVVVKQEAQAKVFFPTVTQANEAIAVKLISDESNDLYINIKSDGKVLIEDKVAGKLGLIGKKYKFEPGQYTLTLSSNNYTKTTFLTFK